MIQRHTRRYLPIVYFLMLVAVFTIGCSGKEDPSETLVTCGNHSCGDLVMVTTDTSSDGYQYLEPSLSPDGQTIIFTADWGAIPSTDRPPDPEPETRQILTVPVQVGEFPTADLQQIGGKIVRLALETVFFGGQATDVNGLDQQKGGPVWVDPDTIVCWLRLPRGNRLIRVGGISSLSSTSIQHWEILYYEEEDSQISGRVWQHKSPALSPDGQWLAFARHGCALPQDPETCTQQAIWVLQMSTAGQDGAFAFPVTTEAGIVDYPCWSPDGSKLLFAATPDFVGDYSGFGEEIFTVDFDTTGLAQNGSVALNPNLDRLTYNQFEEGDPLGTTMRNYAPVYSADGTEVYFVSTRRAPSITLRVRNIWSVPADGRLEPSILFFSRNDEADPYIDPVSGRMVLSSALGFPTEMLDRIEQDAYERILRDVENNPDANLTEVEIRELAAAERAELEFFAGVMSQLFVFSGW